MEKPQFGLLVIPLLALGACTSTGAIAPQTLVAAANGLSGANTLCTAANAGLVIVNTQPALTHLVKNNGQAIAAGQAACAAIQAIDQAVVAAQAQAAAPVIAPSVAPVTVPAPVAGPAS